MFSTSLYIYNLPCIPPTAVISFLGWAVEGYRARFAKEIASICRVVFSFSQLFKVYGNRECYLLPQLSAC